MNIKEYNSLESIIKFYYFNKDIYYYFNNKVYELTKDNLNILKDELIIPYKMEFKNIPINIVIEIIEKIKNDDSNLFAYRIKDNMNDTINYYAILTESQKVKQIK